MKPYRAYFEKKYEICIYGVLFISAVLPALVAVNGIRISPDSMIYALISQEIVSGNGIRLPIIYDLRDNQVFVNGSVPYLGVPPLLPMLFALLGGVTLQSYLAAQIINVLSHVVISILTFLLMEKFYDNKGISILTAMLVSYSIPLLKLANYILSDTLCIALTVAVIYFLTLSRCPDQHRANRYLSVASICTSAAILTRFAGIALVPVFFWGTLILVKNKNIKLKHAPTVLTIILPFITAIALFISTYSMSGSIHGWTPPSPDRSYLAAFTGTIKMGLLQFHLGERPVLLVSTLFFLFALYIMVNSHTRRELLKYVHSGLDLIIVFIISHTAMITHSMVKSQSVFEWRYMSPLVPFLFVISMVAIVIVREVIRSKGFSKLSLSGMILSLGIITCCNGYKTYMNAGDILSKQEGHYHILNSPTYHWIKENYGENVIITTNRPFHLSFFGGYPTVRLPHRRFEKNSWVPDNMDSFLPNRMSQFGSRVLVLFEEVDEQHEGGYLAKLFNKREDDDKFILIHKSPDGVVYNLKE